MARKSNQLKVVHFQRRPQEAQFSLERLFDAVRHALPADIRCHEHVAPCASRGLWRRLINIANAACHQCEVNHVTGDVHYLALLLRKKRTLLTIADCRSLHRLTGWRREVLRVFWYAWPMRRVALVSVISETTKAELLRYVEYPPDKIRVVYCCVSPEFAPDPKTFNDQRPRILQIGTGGNKNLLRVAAALAGIPCHLRIIGQLDAEQTQALAHARADYSSVHNLSDEQMAVEYRNCDLVVFPSTYEGFGLPIIEANAMGRPVITSNLLPMSEVAGDAACLVDPLDVASIQFGVSRVVEDKKYRNQLVERGYINAQRFTPPAVAEGYAALYREIAATWQV